MGANFNFNKVILGGRLTANPELKTISSGASVTSFTIAISRNAKKGDEAKTDFINCVAWRKTAEFICKYFSKGSSICVVGEIQTRSWTDNNGQKRYSTEVIVDELNFVDSKGENTSGEQIPSATTNNAGNAGFDGSDRFETLEPDDDLPF